MGMIPGMMGIVIPLALTFETQLMKLSNIVEHLSNDERSTGVNLLLKMI